MILLGIIVLMCLIAYSFIWITDRCFKKIEEYEKNNKQPL